MKKVVIGIICAAVLISGSAILLLHRQADDPKQPDTPSSANTEAAKNSEIQTDSIRYKKPRIGAYTITIKDMISDQPNISIIRGSSVTWINNDTVAHTVSKAGDNDTPGPNSGTLEPGQSYSFTFNTDGEFGYVSTLHPSMNGLVIVSED